MEIMQAGQRHYEQICAIEAASYPADEAASPEGIAVGCISVVCVCVLRARHQPDRARWHVPTCRCACKRPRPSSWCAKTTRDRSSVLSTGR